MVITNDHWLLISWFETCVYFKLQTFIDLLLTSLQWFTYFIRVVHSSHFRLLFGYFLFYFLVTFSKMRSENDLKMKAKRSLFAKWAYTPHFPKRLLFAFIFVFIFVFTFCRSFNLRSDAWALAPPSMLHQRSTTTLPSDLYHHNSVTTHRHHSHAHSHIN